ncbi:DNA-directed RNA polymerase subunit beta' [Frankliniella fusca]|uniref:DNA-directed RNA polymerase subunit beta n=1 Tax=Frankliniella fusca TaxID=407009 RepID=A0AAE1I2E0_9NEOP|nr:DNA-directed RNA polymerase subunit beta' [Frankliniella fusca]
MQSKTTEAYQLVLEQLKGLGLKVSKAITDWEASERLAWRQAFPDVLVQGCVWHFIRVGLRPGTKCLYRKACALGLRQLWTFTRADDEMTASRFLRLCCLLPRLPWKYIRKGYDEVRNVLEEIEEEDHTQKKQKCIQFASYVYRTWVNKSDQFLQELSVYDNEVAATSALESVNRKVNTLVGDAHPTPFKFIKLVQKLEQTTYEEWRRWQCSGSGFSRTRSGRSAYKNAEYHRSIAVAKSTWGRQKDIMAFLLTCQGSLEEDFNALILTPDDLPVEPLQVPAEEANNQIFMQEGNQLEDPDEDPDDPPPLQAGHAPDYENQLMIAQDDVVQFEDDGGAPPAAHHVPDDVLIRREENERQVNDLQYQDDENAGPPPLQAGTAPDGNMLIRREENLLQVDDLQYQDDEIAGPPPLQAGSAPNVNMFIRNREHEPQLHYLLYQDDEIAGPPLQAGTAPDGNMLIRREENLVQVDDLQYQDDKFAGPPLQAGSAPDLDMYIIRDEKEEVDDLLFQDEEVAGPSQQQAGLAPDVNTSSNQKKRGNLRRQALKREKSKAKLALKRKLRKEAQGLQ